MPRSPEEIQKALGANQPVPVRTQPHGSFGVIQLQAELAERLHTGARAGRPSDPTWTIRRLVGFRAETWQALTDIAFRLSTPRRRVSPGQVAASLIEDGIENLRDKSSPTDGEPRSEVASGRRRKRA